MNMAEILGALMIVSWFLGLQTQNKWIIGSTCNYRTELMYLVINSTVSFMVGKKSIMDISIGTRRTFMVWIFDLHNG